jgi:hypothetical protein
VRSGMKKRTSKSSKRKLHTARGIIPPLQWIR